jgi:hypothetical protein
MQIIATSSNCVAASDAIGGAAMASGSSKPKKTLLLCAA